MDLTADKNSPVLSLHDMSLSCFKAGGGDGDAVFCDVYVLWTFCTSEYGLVSLSDPELVRRRLALIGTSRHLYPTATVKRANYSRNCELDWT